MTNYICINGQKAELTEEQLKALGIELKKETPFDRRKLHGQYYMITNKGEVWQSVELNDSDDWELYKVANYCADHDLMEQRCLYEILHRQLWRFAMENNTELNKYEPVWVISYDRSLPGFKMLKSHIDYTSIGDIIFSAKDIAERAIIEIIQPFTKEHPELKNYYKI